MKKLKMTFAAIVAALALPIGVHASTVALAVQKPVVSGLAATYNGSLSAANTYTFSNNGKVILHIKNTNAAISTVTVSIPVTFSGYAIASPSVFVPATTGDLFVGPFPPSVFNDSNDNVSFTIANATNLTVAVLGQ